MNIKRSNAVHMLIWPVWVPYQVVSHNGAYLGDWWAPLPPGGSGQNQFIAISHSDMTITSKTVHATRWLVVQPQLGLPQVKNQPPF